MLKKEITYIDFDGNNRTEVFYFNLTKAEVAEMELSEKIITGLHDQELKKNIKKNMDIRIIEFEIGKILEEFYEMIENTKI